MQTRAKGRNKERYRRKMKILLKPSNIYALSKRLSHDNHLKTIIRRLGQGHLAQFDLNLYYLIHTEAKALINHADMMHWTCAAISYLHCIDIVLGFGKQPCIGWQSHIVTSTLLLFQLWCVRVHCFQNHMCFSNYLWIIWMK